jgi:hypothetical protein
VGRYAQLHTGSSGGVYSLVLPGQPIPGAIYIGTAAHLSVGNRVVMELLTTGTDITLTARHDDNTARITGPVTATSPQIPLSPSTWNYWELGVIFGAGDGQIMVRFNNALVIHATGLNIPNQATNFRYSQGSNTLQRFDDLYICDGSGSVNNGFLGDVRIRPLITTGPGAHGDLGATAEPPWQQVSGLSASNATFVGSSTPGDRSTFTMSDLPSSLVEVKGVQWVGAVSKSDSGAISARRLLRSGGTTYAGNDLILGTSVQRAREVFNADPTTDDPWTPEGVNALEAGFEVRAG